MIEFYYFLIGMVAGVTGCAIAVLIFAWWKLQKFKKQFGGLLG